MINLLPETSGYDIDGRPVTAQTGHCPMKKRCPRSCRPNDLQWQLAEVFLVTRNASVLRPRATDASQPHISTVRENVVAVELAGTDIALCAVGRVAPRSSVVKVVELSASTQLLAVLYAGLFEPIGST